MDEEISDEIYQEICEDVTEILVDLKAIEEKFVKIQENPALYGPENGLTAQELELLEKLIKQCHATSIAGEAIMKRYESE